MDVSHPRLSLIKRIQTMSGPEIISTVFDHLCSKGVGVYVKYADHGMVIVSDEHCLRSILCYLPATILSLIEACSILGMMPTHVGGKSMHVVNMHYFMGMIVHEGNCVECPS